MKPYFLRLLVVCFLLALLPGAALPASVIASSDLAPVSERAEAGKVLDFRAESPHPAVDGWAQSYSFPGAEFVRLHFKGFHLQEGDKLLVSSPDGLQSWEYTGKGANHNGDFWSFAINGDTVKSYPGRAIGQILWFPPGGSRLWHGCPGAQYAYSGNCGWR